MHDQTPAPQFGASYGMTNQVRDLGNNHLLRSDCGLRLFFPSWESQTWFRPFACTNGQGGLLPWRTGAGEKDFTDWFAFLPPVVRLGGDVHKVTYIDFDFAVGPSGPTPYMFIRQAVRRQAKNGAPGWESLFKGGNNKGPAIPRPDNMILLQGLCLLNGEENYTQQPLFSTILLPSSASDEFINSLRQPGVDPNGSNLEQIFAHGDVTHPVTGSYLQIVGKNKSLLSRPVAQPAPNQNRFASAEKKDREFQKYDVLWHQPHQVPADYMLAMVKPWTQIIRAMSLQEQTDTLCGAFSPWITRAAFMDTQFEAFVPLHTRTAWDRTANQVAMGGYGVQQQQQQNPQGYGGYGAPQQGQAPLMQGMMGNVAPQNYGAPTPPASPAYGAQMAPPQQQFQQPPQQPPQQMQYQQPPQQQFQAPQQPPVQQQFQAPQQPPAVQYQQPTPPMQQGYPTAQPTAPVQQGYPTAPSQMQYQQPQQSQAPYQQPAAPPVQQQFQQPQQQVQYQQPPVQQQFQQPPQQQFQAPPQQQGVYTPPGAPGGMNSPQAQQTQMGMNSSLQRLQELVANVNSAPPNAGVAPGAPATPPGMQPPVHPQQ